jgi:hypothetical protein
MEDPTPLSSGREGDGWHLSLRRHRLIPLTIAALSGVCVVLAGVQAVERNIEVMVVLLILAAAFAPAPWWLNRRRADPFYVDSGLGSGLLLPVNPRTWAFALSAFFMGAGFVEFGFALEVRAAHEGDRSIGIMLLALIGGFGVLLWVRTFDALRSRFRPNLGLLLTPESIVVNTDARPLHIPWDAVTAVRAHWVRLSDGDWLEVDDDVRNLLTLEVHRRLVARKPRPLDVSRLACEPDLAVAILRFYLATPDARDELWSVAAAERVASISAGD